MACSNGKQTMNRKKKRWPAQLLRSNTKAYAAKAANISTISLTLNVLKPKRLKIQPAKRIKQLKISFLWEVWTC